MTKKKSGGPASEKTRPATPSIMHRLLPSGRTIGQMIDSKIKTAAADPQTSLFAEINSRKKILKTTHLEIQALQNALVQKSGEFYSGRAPVSWKFGYIPVPLEILLASDITALDKIVFMVLLRYNFIKGEAFPSESRIAKEVGRSIRTVQRSLSDLIARGYIQISIRRVRGNRWVNQYWLNLEDITTARKR